MLSKHILYKLHNRLNQSLVIQVFYASTHKISNPFQDAPPLSNGKKPMKKPIIIGRKSSNTEHELDDEHSNPFIGKDIPYGRKIIFDAEMEEDLANGQHWHVYNDRFMQTFEHDLVDRGWGNDDMYKSPMCKRGMEDITGNHDYVYHYKVNNIKMHVEMMRYISHLKPLFPELKNDLDGVTANWQDILEDVLGEAIQVEESDEVISTEDAFGEANDYRKVTKTTLKTLKTLKSKKVRKYENRNRDRLANNTTIMEDKPLCGDDVVQLRKAKLAESLKPEPNRKEAIKREIELNTIKQFVDDKVAAKDFVRIIFIDALGTKYYVYGMIGETLLQCARRYLIPIDGYCDGFDRGIMRIYGKGPWCHTCQMDISPKYFHLIPPYDYREQAQFVSFRHITPTSRLGCCIWIRGEFDGMLINIPVSLPNPYGRFND